jgi:RND family efflux transporter MFP subunit
MACARAGGDARREDAGVTPAVEAVQARVGTLPLEERVSGVVKAHNQVAIHAEIEAPIVAVMVRSGEAVEEGQPLVRLQDDALRDQLRQAEAAVRLEEAAAKAARARVAELEAQASRARALAKEQLVSRLELETVEAQLAAAEASADQADARVEQARATVEERRTALRRSIVRSPVAGRVGRRQAEVGMIASPSTLLFEVGNLDEVIVEVPLTGEMLGHVREGQPVRIGSQSLGGEPIQARLSRIPPFLAAGSFSTVGEIDVRNGDGRLRPGMFVNVDILYGESDRATLVPTSALWEDPRTGVRGVFVLDLPEGAAPAPEAGKTGVPALSAEPVPVALRSVEVVAEGRAAAGVRGLEEGEWVVTVGQHLLGGDRGAAARFRPTSWDRVLDLQSRQREDLVQGFLEKQQRMARAQGAEPPSNEEFLGKPAASAAPRRP